MGLTARQLNRATLARQMLLHRESLDVAEGVRRCAVLQAQEPASPYLALWNRLAEFDPADLDTAFTERTVVRATLIRITLHVVHVGDYPRFHRAMLHLLRAARLGDSRFTSTGLSAVGADALLPELAEFAACPRTGSEIEDLLATRLGERKRGVWWALRTFAPLHYAPTGGPWWFGTPSSFVTAETMDGPESETESLRWLALRYLEAFGPASAADFAAFTMLRRPAVARALRALDGRIEELEGTEGKTLYDVPGAPRPAGEAAAPPRLLPMWDSILLAYADRGRIVPADCQPLVYRRNGNVLPTLLADGYVAGVWRPVQAGIEVTAFRRLDDHVWRQVATEASALMAFLAGREPAAYRRYAHWWAKPMPSAEVRVLPG